MVLTKDVILDDQHWTIKDYKQRIPAKQWKQLLLNDDDQIIFKGRVTKLKVNRLGLAWLKSIKILKITINQGDVMKDIMLAVQKEVSRIRDMISTTKALLPKGNVNFSIYEITLDAAEKAVREQDAALLVRLLPELKEMH